MSQNIAAAPHFLNVITGNQPVTFQTFDDDKDRRNPNLIGVMHGTLSKHANRLTKLNNEGAGIFIMVNEGDLKGRSKDNVVKVRCLFVDLDGAPLEPVKNGPLPPHIIVKSSPGRYHAYWRVDDIELEEFRSIQKALAARFDSDPVVNDLPRVMRVPGFIHCKGDPYRSRLLKASKAKAYSREEFLNAFNIDPTNDPKPTKKSRAKKREARMKFDGRRLTIKLRRKIRLALKHISSVGYDEWLKVGMALHSTGDKHAYELWDKWSRRRVEKYDEDVQAYKWNSFGGQDGIGLPTIYRFAKKDGFNQRGLIPGIRPDQLPRNVSIKEGRKQFKSLVDDLINDPTHSNGSRRVVAIDVTPGFGKTTMAWEAVMEADLKVEAYVPTHKLADEIVSKLKSQYGVVDIRSIKGRDVEGMCLRPELIMELFQLGITSVNSLVCEKRAKGKDIVTCPFISECPYVNQHKPAQIKLLTHANMQHTRKAFDTVKPDFIVIDEQFLQHVVGKEEWSIAGLMRSPHKLVNDIAQILTSNNQLLPELNKLYPDLRQTTVDIIEELKTDKPTMPDINPGMNEKKALQALSSFIPDVRPQSPLNLLETLLTAIDSGAPNTQAIWCGLQDPTPGDKWGTQPVIKAIWLLHPDRLKDIPILIIDGSMAINAIKRLFPEVEHHKVRVGRYGLGKVTQVYSTPVINRSLTPYASDSSDRHKEAKSRKIRTEQAIERLLAKHGGPGLIVGTKRFMKDLRVPKGIHKAHFGAFLGLNEWEQCKWVMIIGRNQPPTEAMVDQARAFYGNDKRPLNTDFNLEKLPVGYQIKSGERVGAWVQCHIDPRVQQFMHLARENQSEQAMDRTRLVHPGELKPVYIMSNIPLDIEVDELVSLKQFLAGKSKLQQVWERLGKRVMPLNHKWLFDNNRDLFSNQRQVKTTIENERKYDKFPYIYSLWKNVLIKYKIKGKRGPHDSCLSSLSRKGTKEELEIKHQSKVALV
jgi:hypothetical protein